MQLPQGLDKYNIKLVDFGNACWTDKHFTDNIQTCEYRAPEAILKAKYDTSCDIWSFACMIFELLTGDYLFDPHEEKVKVIKKKEDYQNQDHLALFHELLGQIPLSIQISGHKDLYEKYFNKNGGFLHIKTVTRWTLKEVLLQKYKFVPYELRLAIAITKEDSFKTKISFRNICKSICLFSIDSTNSISF
ncbi:MAG: putative SRSF protein kinase 1 [Streblomastix strix]|uniref:non-specific serine/threonine protein kinase n=1 Tax=Streblomastix strix TaxID=222440 RepID=A0A5J4UBJ6_9EUKA|nr:MAG: putative SRSF protein kinase 1 [Streblomastix strix]